MRCLGLLALLLTACGSSGEGPTPATCARVGQQCRLPTGPLGVCQRADGDGFVCTPQH
ncbi:MAG: hypothetical protein KC549_09455 [Myxococcales bacterium]|nr:hypothetical protein [Myxococcales bacterium]MCB9546642.1 hypothetical protein [Myxococcales bacterium]